MNKLLALMVAFSAVTTFAGNGEAAPQNNVNAIEGDINQDGGRRENPVPMSRFSNDSGARNSRKPKAYRLGGSSDPRQRRQH